MLWQGGSVHENVINVINVMNVMFLFPAQVKYMIHVSVITIVSLCVWQLCHSYHIYHFPTWGCSRNMRRPMIAVEIAVDAALWLRCVVVQFWKQVIFCSTILEER